MVSNNTPLVGLVTIILVILIAGTVLGVALGGTDLLNFFTAPAEAERIRMENQNRHLDAQQERDENAKDRAAQRELMPITRYAVLIIGMILSAGASVYVMLAGWSRMIVAQAEAQTLRLQTRQDYPGIDVPQMEAYRRVTHARAVRQQFGAQAYNRNGRNGNGHNPGWPGGGSYPNQPYSVSGNGNGNGGGYGHNGNGHNGNGGRNGHNGNGYNHSQGHNSADETPEPWFDVS